MAKVEIDTNELNGDWYFDLALSFQRTRFHHTYRYCLSLALGFFTVYLRFAKQKNK